MFASYSSARLRTWHTQCDFWAINILSNLVLVVHLQSKWKAELRSVMEWQFWLIRSFHCMLCCSDSESKWWIHVSSWITSCKINFCWVSSVTFEKLFTAETCAQFWYSILDTIWQTLCSYTENAQKIYSQKVTLRMSCSEPCYHKKQILF